MNNTIEHTRSTVDPSVPIGGRDLRYLLTWLLIENGPLTVARLADLVTGEGFDLGGRRSKVVSDSLRWEIAWGRVERIGWGTYAARSIPITTSRRIRHRVKALRTHEERSSDERG